MKTITLLTLSIFLLTSASQKDKKEKFEKKYEIRVDSHYTYIQGWDSIGLTDLKTIKGSWTASDTVQLENGQYKIYYELFNVVDSVVYQKYLLYSPTIDTIYTKKLKKK